jgi:hypothetical protein
VQGIPIRLSNTLKSVHFTTVTQGGFTGVTYCEIAINPLPELLMLFETSAFTFRLGSRDLSGGTRERGTSAILARFGHNDPSFAFVF